MGYSHSSGLELVPNEDPPEDLVGEDLFEAFGMRHSAERLPLLWSAALASALERHDSQEHRVAGWYLTSYGFLNPELEENAFGIIIHALPLMGSTSGIVDRLQVGDHRFPITIRRWPYTPHAPAINPKNGRSTCWARNQSNSNIGLLTAKHVIDRSSQPLVNLVDSRGGWTTGNVINKAPDPIDAATIDVPGSNSKSINTHAPEYYVAPWATVDIDIGLTTLTTKIVSITDVRGKFRSPYIPARLFTAQAGQRGDSGALVLFSAHQDNGNQRNGEWVGIYTGEMRNPVGQYEGVCQHLGQVLDVLNVEVGE